MQRAVNYTGVSESTLYRLQRQILKPERKSRQDKVVLDDFDKGVIRRTIQELFVCQKRLPSINVLMEELKDFKGGRACLRECLHELGFQWKKTQNNRSVHIERSDVVAARIFFPQKYQEVSRRGTPNYLHR